jgi:hypothetical protein
MLLQDAARMIARPFLGGDAKLSSRAIRRHILYTVSRLANVISAMLALTNLVESSHRFISTSDLDLSEVCLAVVAFLFPAVDLCLVDVLPAVGATEHIFDFLALHHLALKVALVQDHLVGTCSAFKSVDVCKVLLIQRKVVRRNRCDGQEVRATRADLSPKLVLCQEEKLLEMVTYREAC